MTQGIQLLSLKVERNRECQCPCPSMGIWYADARQPVMPSSSQSCRQASVTIPAIPCIGLRTAAQPEEMLCVKCVQRKQAQFRRYSQTMLHAGKPHCQHWQPALQRLCGGHTMHTALHLLHTCEQQTRQGTLCSDYDPGLGGARHRVPYS